MARAPGKHGRDQALDFQGFLNDLQDWELLKDTDKKMKKKSQASDMKIGEDERSTGKTSSAVDFSSSSGMYDHSRNFDAINRLSNSFAIDESTVDATTEKELGNEYFKQKKYKEAIECYSRSIALSPTAVAYANRAMAYLKIKRFPEAEDDCTEALNLDDRYIKAYSRRATARKELGKLKESIEDSEFALKLEPNNQEIKKQYAEVKSLYEKKASESLRSSLQGAKKGGRSETSVNGHAVHPVSNVTRRTGASASQKDKAKENDGDGVVKKSVYVEEIKNKSTGAGSRSDGQLGNDSRANAIPSSNAEIIQRNNRAGRQELKASVKELASQAASRAMAEAAKNITPPNSAYQFEVSWRGFSGDRALQAHLLKVTTPSALPQIFKNALSVTILIDIIKCVFSFFINDMDLAVKYLENLTKVPRFDILIMCLPSTDKADLLKMWDEVFCSEATPIEYAEILDKMRSRYCPKC
ncbi:PREDICTED: RNA polymerase II-associated protein 3 isoform X3 [Populus euphratica]|uniref:RNA polymerase II-associated protein 3 isoform X3 n=1 Tax=Populus euphratica TaxID=75702 RepID=A0AAJ6XLX1_POPEU|nr:PREDICTED: RNA polymerase II-associated protein 3 isoform X3 [Populus euphratica]